MSATIPEHGKSIPETMESARENISADKDSMKENVCTDTDSLKETVCTDTDSMKENICADNQPLKQNVCVDVEAATVYDTNQEKERNDPAALLRRRTYKLIDYLTDATPWSFAFSCASLFMVPLMLCIDVECMGDRLPLSVRNLWYTQAVVIITIISVNLLLAALLCVKFNFVKLCLILNYTLLAFYYVLAFILYVATEPYDTQMAMRVSHVTCSIACGEAFITGAGAFATDAEAVGKGSSDMEVPNWILCRSMTKNPKEQSVGGTNA